MWYKNPSTWKGNMGTAVVLGGSLMYTYVKLQEDEKKKLKSIEVSSISRSQSEMESAFPPSSSSAFRRPDDSKEESRPMLRPDEDTKATLRQFAANNK